MLKLSLTALAATCVLGAPLTAEAAGRYRVVVEQFAEPYEFAVDCSDFGPYAFDNLVSGRQRVRVVDVFSAGGTLLQTEFHIALSETDTNSETGETMSLRGTVREVWNYGPGTRTLSGAAWIGHQPGKGAVVHDSGRITMTLDTRIAQFLAGPKEVFFGNLDVIACAVLAED